jgi:tetratricopeptide (TPR) repeat protein
MTRLFAAALLSTLLLVYLPACLDGQVPTEFMGNPYKDDSARAADHYGRGVKALRKAHAETDAKKRLKLFERAKTELGKAAGLTPNYDHFLALGQAYLGLEDKKQAEVACRKALAYKPEAEEATQCVEQARGAS